MNASAVVADITPRPGYRALHYLLPLHAAPLAAVVLFYRGGAIWQPLLLAVVVAFSWFYLRRHSALGFGRRALVRLVAHADGEWHLEDAAGTQLHAHLSPHSVVVSQFMLLNFRLASGKRRSRFLMGDEAGEDVMRRLRAHLLETGPDKWS